MRLQLTRLAATALGLGFSLVVAATGYAQPQPAGSGSTNGKFATYFDNDSTTVHTFLVDGTVALPEGTRVGAHVLVDIISSASVDVVSNASVDVVSGATARLNEVRYEVGGQAGVFITDEVDLAVLFTGSEEPDWISYTPAATLGVDLARRNTRLTAGYGYSFNDVRQGGDENFREQLDAHTAQVGLSQIIDRLSLIGAAYTFQTALGFQSSPYRKVTTADGRFALRERHPEQRYRHALTVQGLRYLDTGLALELSYRLYGDDWGVTSNTLMAALRIELAKHWDLRIRGRGYYQSSANFWQEHYDGPAELMSADRELSTFWDAGTGVKVAWHDYGWMVAAKIDGTYYHFIDFALMDSRLSLALDVGLRYRW